MATKPRTVDETENTSLTNNESQPPAEHAMQDGTVGGETQQLRVLSGGAAALPDFMQADAEEFAGAGSSDRAEDNMVPILVILQKGSPQVDENDPGYVQGAKQGMFLETASLKLYRGENKGDESAGILAIHAHFIRKQVEWIPRAQGGGFVASHHYDTPLLREAKEVPNPQNPDGRPLLMLPNGHQLVDTAEHYLILLPDMVPVVMNLTSTGLQTHRRWNRIYQDKRVRLADGSMRPLPSFQTLVRLNTVYNTNDKGSWFSLKVTDLGPVPREYIDGYYLAREFYKRIVAGLVRVAEPQAEMSEGAQPQRETLDNDDSPL